MGSHDLYRSLAAAAAPVRSDVPRLTAILWDVDGTLAETERDGHLPAFNAAFAACGLGWRWSLPEYRALLAIAGGRERLEYDLARRPDAPTDAVERAALASRLHRCKQAILAERSVRHAPPLRDGVLALMRDCDAAGVAMGIATSTGRRNIAGLMSAHFGAAWEKRFACVVGAEDAPRKKPDPQVYQIALARLGVGPDQVVAIEDSPHGAIAAQLAGLSVIVTRSLFFPEPASTGALATGPGLGDSAGWTPAAPGGRISLDAIRRWRDLEVRCDRGARLAGGRNDATDYSRTPAFPMPSKSTSTRFPARA